MLQCSAFNWEAADLAPALRAIGGRGTFRGLGDAARHIGPEWDLVGSGTAYVKSLERTAGTLLPAAKLRPAVPPGEPFVLRRNRDEPRGHATLQSTLEAVQDGDTIEVRGDGPFTGAILDGRQRGGTLTIRGAWLPAGVQYERSLVDAEG